MRFMRMLLCLVAWVATSRAATFTWSNATGNSNFADPGNWTGGQVPPSDGTATLIFTDQGAGFVRPPVTFSANQIQFQNTAATAYNFGGIGYMPLLTIQNGFNLSP